LAFWKPEKEEEEAYKTVLKEMPKLMKEDMQETKGACLL
jgi:hypothetical protein